MVEWYEYSSDTMVDAMFDEPRQPEKTKVQNVLQTGTVVNCTPLVARVVSSKQSALRGGTVSRAPCRAAQ